MVRNLSCVVIFALVLGLLVSASSVRADEQFLDAYLDKYSDGAGGFEYDVGFEANKIDAITGRIDIGTDSYALVYYSENGWNGWEPVDTYYDDYEDLTFAELTTALAKSWTLTWDAGEATQTTCAMDFGAVAESDWLDVPTITYPTAGDSPTPKNLTVTWTWDGDPNGPHLDEIEACVEHVNLDLEYWESLANDALSWTPPELAGGDWEADVWYCRDFKGVPDGLTIGGNEWVLDNETWLCLDSGGFFDFTVVPEPGCLMFLAAGAVALIRRRRG